ncbi:LuxR C-terminal-related transcriptional regulator [Rufibacter soli]|jgi:DNA-binding CsgD family transcriptional regulator
MEFIIYDEAKKIWQAIHEDSSHRPLDLELRIHKRLMNTFHLGDYYYFIFNNLEASIEYVSENMSTILGYQPEEFTVPFMVEKIHPEDRPFFLNFEATKVDFFKQMAPEKCLKYKVRYDYRLQHADGNYLRILQQSVCAQVGEEAHLPLRALGMHTDITHLKLEGKPMLSFIGMEGEPSYIDVKPKQAFSPQKEVLSKREKEVLGMVIDGKPSRKISEELHISMHTVNTHRKNILAKAQVASSSELVAKAIKEGWV